MYRRRVFSKLEDDQDVAEGDPLSASAEPANQAALNRRLQHPLNWVAPPAHRDEPDLDDGETVAISNGAAARLTTIEGLLMGQHELVGQSS